MNCTLCGATLSVRKDNYFYDCVDCEAIVKGRSHYLTAEEEKVHYESHNNDITDERYQNFSMPITSYVLGHFTSRHKGLDFGSGTGPVISHLLLKNDYDIIPYDPFFAPNDQVFNGTYDYIVSCEVFEHFKNPKKEITRLAAMLKPEGKLLIMTLLYNDTIDFDKWFYKRDPTHIFIYRKETIAYIAQKLQLGVEVLEDRFIVLSKSAE